MKKSILGSIVIAVGILLLSINFAYADDPILPTIPKVSVFVRSGDTVVYSADIDLPASGTVSIPDISGTTHDIDADSVLAILYSLTQNPDPSFTISDLEYYSSYNAFYLKCLKPKDSDPLCDNWQYVVNNVTPGAGMDTTVLSGGENLALYFGNPHKLNLDKNTIFAGEQVNVSTEKYNYLDNTWGKLDGVSIDVTTPNPNDPWNPTLISETPVDADGKATIQVLDAGTYTLGIKEDFSFPSYSLLVNPVIGGGGGGPTLLALSVSKAANFLASNQKSDGSFGDPLYTDWAAIAIGALGGADNGMRAKITYYLNNNQLVSNVVTDNERRAMALMSLGINPYTGTSTDYINKIVVSWDGSQFGDPSLYNDDIFALIVLNKAGYSSVDKIMSDDISYIISKQGSDGSWDDVDMTAAAILALRNYTDLSGVQNAISKAENYLLNKQQGDGGFGNSSSTSWALQALSGNLSLTMELAKADDYIARLQQTDGGIDINTNTIENRIWATSYALAGALHMSWSNIMQSFPKPSTPSGGGIGTPPADPVKKDEPKEEPKLEEIKKIELEIKLPEVIKKIKVKKQKKNKLSTEAVKGEVLGASTIGAVSENVPKISAFMKVVSTLETPFFWLWGKLGF